jgi:hypothetical protein
MSRTISIAPVRKSVIVRATPKPAFVARVQRNENALPMKTDAASPVPCVV